MEIGVVCHRIISKRVRLAQKTYYQDQGSVIRYSCLLLSGTKLIHSWCNSLALNTISQLFLLLLLYTDLYPSLINTKLLFLIVIKRTTKKYIGLYDIFLKCLQKGFVCYCCFEMLRLCKLRVRNTLPLAKYGDLQTSITKIRLHHDYICKFNRHVQVV